MWLKFRSRVDIRFLIFVSRYIAVAKQHVRTPVKIASCELDCWLRPLFEDKCSFWSFSQNEN